MSLVVVTLAAGGCAGLWAGGRSRSLRAGASCRSCSCCWRRGGGWRKFRSVLVVVVETGKGRCKGGRMKRLVAGVCFGRTVLVVGMAEPARSGRVEMADGDCGVCSWKASGLPAWLKFSERV